METLARDSGAGAYSNVMRNSPLIDRYVLRASVVAIIHFHTLHQ